MEEEPKSKAKALKRATWFRGVKEDSEESWKPLPPSRPGGRIAKKRKIFRKAGNERAVEHVRDAKSFSVKSHIVKHWMTTHASLSATLLGWGLLSPGGSRTS